MSLEETTPPPAKRKLLPILIGAVLMALCGGGGFFLSYKGFLPDLHRESGDKAPSPADTAFVPLDPILVSIGPESARHLRFSAQIEVPKDKARAVEELKPRIADILNSYLHVLTPEEIEAPGSLIRLRAQMLRRARIVTGEGMIDDLLITEFVLN
ncbi:flagellar basal body-associated FliL family protein [Paenirhodobacter enshiensis]|uniref:flagellar basal body-associated FliL family protein n=1 Tax=Paenirhodobacter enshiensis TaxID=1105367 RepID=UPI0035AFDEC9